MREIRVVRFERGLNLRHGHGQYFLFPMKVARGFLRGRIVHSKSLCKLRRSRAVDDGLKDMIVRSLSRQE